MKRERRKKTGIIRKKNPDMRMSMMNKTKQKISNSNQRKKWRAEGVKQQCLQFVCVLYISRKRIE